MKMYKNTPLSDLTHKELANAMKELNLNIGPITSTTRKIYENRLRSHLEQSDKKSDNKDEEGEGENNSKCNGTALQQEAPMLNGTPNNELKVSERSNIDEESPPDYDGFYFGVWIPVSPTRFLDKDKPNVFRSQQDALKKAKEYKGSRFKSFRCKSDATDFALSHPDPTRVDKICETISSAVTSEVTKTIKSPTFQELMKFRRAIEENDIQFVQQCLFNPKYLISSGDMPVMLQEGTRLHALHVAVKYNKLNMCKLVLNTIQSDSFLQLMYPGATEDNIAFRKKHLIDLYLNTPEKILCDTPLHMACKFGFVDIVAFLLSCDQLNRHAKNKDGKTCQQVMGTRVSARGEQRNMILKNISELFQVKAYVPLYCGEESLPKVGEPIVTLSPDGSQLYKQNIKAYAGPMSPDKASTLFLQWKKSPRDRLYGRIARSDYEKGMERIGRTIAAKEKVPFNEYWHFLSSFIQLSSTEGLERLENYLKNKSELSLKENEGRRSRMAFTSAKKTTKSRLSSSPDDLVKRKLDFDLSENNNAIASNQSETSNGLTDISIHQLKNKSLSGTRDDLNQVPERRQGNLGCNTLEENQNSLNKNHSRQSDSSKNQNSLDECFCRCGQLLEYCEKCTVEIDVDMLSVSFKTCSLREKSPSEKTLQNSFEKVNGKIENGNGNEVATEKILVDAGGDRQKSVDASDGDNDVNNDSDVKDDDDFKPHVFIDGDVPSKYDVDVFRALPDVILDSYPYIQHWKKYIEDFPVQIRQSWPSPGSPRYSHRRHLLWTA